MTDINNDVSIEALSKNTVSHISALLNPIKYIPTENNLPRHWLGLAQLCQIKGELISSIYHDTDSCKKVLKLWFERDAKGATINKLLKYLEELDRFDIIDDITPLLENDIKLYQIKPTQTAVQIDLAADKHILTTDDVSRINAGLEPLNYDAFVLFADDDIDFATEVIETMEKQYKMRFCVKERDLVGGACEHDGIIRLITERCNRLIVILSQAFFESPANEFFLSYAQSLGIGQRQRKVIPCIYKNCNPLPYHCRCYFLLDYRRSGTLWNFWDKLRDSISAPIWSGERVENGIVNNTPKLEENQKNSLKPALQQHHNNNKTETSLKPINQCVKFNSMVNLGEGDKILSDKSISASPSTISLKGTDTEKVKTTKTKWLKNFFKNSDKKSKISLEEENEKRKFWTRHNKRKVALAN